jgi:hypothetical protein
MKEGHGMAKKKQSIDKDIQDLARRVKSLEARSGVSHETQDFLARVKTSRRTLSTPSTRAISTFKGLADGDAVAPVETVDVEFDLGSTPKAPGMVRLYLPGTQPGEEIATSAKPHGVLPQQVVGSDLQLIMDITGNIGESGSFSVKRALPNPISLQLDDGPTKKSLKYLHVTR